MYKSNFYEGESRRLGAELTEAKNIPVSVKSASVTVSHIGTDIYKDIEKLTDDLKDQVRDELNRAILAARQQKSIQRVNELLRLVKRAEIVCLETGGSSLAGLVFKMACEMMREIVETGEKAFRAFPSSDNYAKWYGARRGADELGVEEKSFAPNFRPQGRKQYVAKRGDTLSKLAQQYYGHANLWDVIYENDKNLWNYHPDRIVPGQKFIIP